MARPNINTVPPIGTQVAPTSNISNLRILVDSDFKGATASFNIVAATNATSIVLLRSSTNSVLGALQLASFPLVVGAYSYDDRAASIVGKQVWYWIQMQNAEGSSTYVGPVTLAVQQGAAPHVVNWISVSSDASTDDSVEVNVVCEVAPLTDWSGGIAVFVANYQGNAATVLIYQDTTQTLSFHLKITGEVVTLYVASVNAAGMLSGLSAGANLTLSGRPTPPCRLTGVIAIEGNGITQVSFSAGLEPGITLYRLYRGAYGGSFLTAAVVATLAATDEPRYSIEDNVVNGGSLTYQWYVTAVIGGIGEGPASDAVYPATAW